MNDKINILGVNISNVTMDSALDFLIGQAKLDEKTTVFTPNSEIIYVAKKDDEFKKILNSASLNCPDGIGVVLASKILHNPLHERVAGYDLLLNMLPHCESDGLSLFLLGSREEVIKKAEQELHTKYPKLKIAGIRNGYFNNDEEVISLINEKNPDILLVCLGAPKQEKWIYNNKDKINAKIFMGLGGSLDVIAGEAKRAPDIFIKLNLEWFYRLLKNPSRIGRMMALPKFALSVLFSKKEENIV